ncbi:hypothetical protein C8F04DRAFT_1091902, partial [Mycena alexandri]
MAYRTPLIPLLLIPSIRPVHSLLLFHSTFVSPINSFFLVHTYYLSCSPLVSSFIHPSSPSLSSTTHRIPVLPRFSSPPALARSSQTLLFLFHITLRPHSTPAISLLDT